MALKTSCALFKSSCIINQNGSTLVYQDLSIASVQTKGSAMGALSVLKTGGKVLGGAASEEIAEKIGCKIHMYDDLGHAAHEEAKDFNRMVYDFFRE